MSKCDSYVKDVFEKIEDIIEGYWGVDPAYYINSNNEQEASTAKLCCKILEAIRMAQGEIDEKDS